MLSSLDPAAQRFLDTLNRIGDGMGRAQRQISTGLRVAQVSDAPAAVPLILAARANANATRQILTNLGRVKSEVDAGSRRCRAPCRYSTRCRRSARRETPTCRPPKGARYSPNSW